ncbi:MAG: phosphoenolpyruvate carboxykinase (ATP) [Ruminococcaceae bacterium]|nr:phosphoenolpyruvate carboxykinase (ATP) [Oscillospiraceae bacterium]
MNSISLEKAGIAAPKAVYRNLCPAKLVEIALANKEGKLSETGAFVVNTGKYTGRSPDDKFIVDTPEYHNDISWGKVNKPIEQKYFDALYEKVCAYLNGKELYVFDGFAGADKKYHKGFRVINEFACQNLFIHQLLVRPTDEELASFEPDYTIIAAPGFKCDPEADHVHSEAAIIIDYMKKIVLIAGSAYAGEIKKSVFSTMNFILPMQGVLPMHCSANKDEEGNTALFFGLSGTGKTTLSADPNRILIGDDEHGWSDNGVFNFEGGCYAKCINLSKEHEPEIWNAIKFGSLVENVVMDENGKLDFDDATYTENTRVGYPIDFIPNADVNGTGNQPKAVIFLTADAFGVLPPISKLDKNMAMYHFVSGYTSKLAGTERGITEPQGTFSTCFGAPFLPLDPSVYAEMLGERLEKTGADVYLINTGWSGGAYGVGSRIKLKYTRAMVTAALNGELAKSEFVLDERFNVYVPKTCPDVPEEILTPKNTWEDKDAYDKTADHLASLFENNFKKYTNMPENIVNAGPKVK